MSEKGTLQSLGLGKEQLEGAEFDQIPESLGQSYPDPPQPGEYRYKLPPAPEMQAIWATVESEKHGTRINAIFEEGAALTIVQSKNNEHNGEQFRWRCSNVPRERTKEKILVSDMDLLLRALGITARPKTNADYAKALLKCAGMEFSATEEFSYSCNPKKDIYVDDGAGGQAKVEGKVGCGARYYQNNISKELSDPNDPASPKVYPLRITCGNDDCGASIRAFPNLTGFKK